MERAVQIHVKGLSEDQAGATKRIIRVGAVQIKDGTVMALNAYGQANNSASVDLHLQGLPYSVNAHEAEPIKAER
jgi:predicted secreted protein